MNRCQMYQLLPKAALFPFLKPSLELAQKEIKFLTTQGTFRSHVHYSCFSKGHDTPKLNIFGGKVECSTVVNSAHLVLSVQNNKITLPVAFLVVY